MPKYCVTMERTSRVAYWFDAKNDEEAERMALTMQDEMKPSDYDSGDYEEDYSLCRGNGTEVVGWN